MEHYKQIPDHLATKTTLLKVHHRKITEKTKVRGTISLYTPHGRKTWYVNTKLYNFFKERNSDYRFLVF